MSQFVLSLSVSLWKWALKITYSLLMLQGGESRRFFGSNAKCKMQKTTQTTVWPLVYVGKVPVVRRCRMEEEHIWCYCCARRRERRSSTPGPRGVWYEEYSAVETTAAIGAQMLRPTTANDLSFAVFTPCLQSKSNVNTSCSSLLCTSIRRPVRVPVCWACT